MIKNNIKINENKAITLIALVVTIIILLILAGVTIGVATNGTGLFEKAKIAKEQYDNAERNEQTEITKITNDIHGYISSDRYDSLENSELFLLTTLTNNSKTKQEYALNDFEKANESNFNDYIEYNETNKNYIIKKSGWYIVDISITSGHSSGWSSTRVDCIINDKAFSKCKVLPQNNVYDCDSKTFTIYLTKNNTLSISKEITGSSDAYESSCEVKIWTMK